MLRPSRATPHLAMLLLLSTVSLLVGCGGDEEGAPPPTSDKSAEVKVEAPQFEEFEALVEAHLAEMDQLLETYRKVQDKASAEAHAGEIERLSARVEALGNQYGKFDSETMKPVVMKHGMRLGSTQGDMATELNRIRQDPALAEPLGFSVSP